MTSKIEDFGAVLVPMQIDAFVLNPEVCGKGTNDDTTARISPITQPNYTFLRLDNFLIQGDLQHHTDLHETAPALVNPRLTNLGAGAPPVYLRHRHGVYIHWTMPRFYRAGVSSGDSVSESRRREERLKRGMKAVPANETGVGGRSDTPDFVQPPTRWIVVRKLDVDTIQPEAAKPSFKDRPYEAWVLESDHLWSLDDIPTGMDLQTDLAPFVVGSTGSDVKIAEQAEVFIGRKTPLADWTGVEDPNAQPPSISLLQSGNQLFADFQMHNANVFSMLDNFQYGTSTAPQYLDYAKASYYVFGWHWKEGVDPLWKSGESVAHGASLDTLFMTLLGVEPSDPWFEETDQLRIMCHGAMYDVVWDHGNKPAKVPADEFNARIVDQNLAATAVGTTPMDAILTYCAARKEHGEGTGDVAKLEEDILALEALLYARDDGVEDQRQAKDTVYNWSFQRAPGGSRYYFSGKDGDGQGSTQPVEPVRAAILKLRELNQTQTLLDAANFSMQQYRWDMFSLWWKYISDVGNKGNTPEDKDYLAKTTDLSAHITELQKRIDQLQTNIQNLLNPPPPTPTASSQDPNLLATAKPASMPNFYRGNDPTVLVGGIGSGWPLDYLDKVSVRAPKQTVALTGDLPDALKVITNQLNKLPAVLQGPALALVTEFYAIDNAGTPGDGQFFPQFHDQKTTDQRWRDQWGNRQPWFPLFAEWEVEYHHIPLDYWTLDEHTARLSAVDLVRYGITVPSEEGQDPPPAPPPLWEALAKEQGDKGPDVRVLSGRALILPQPSFSLGAKIMQLFSNTPPDILDKYLHKDDRDNLLANINQLAYLSLPLTGFTEGILTQAQGSHIKPENNVMNNDGTETTTVISAAIVNSAGMTNDNLGLVQGQSSLTPYATLTNFDSDKYNPFKPVTHGQFRFRKFNIIDKFGQALMAIDQKPRLEGPPPIYPCISDYYEPQTILIDEKMYANTVIQDNTEQCEFLQLPPQINQNARLNFDFVKRIADDPDDMKSGEGGSAKWRPATEWENPIWGWLITNYADYGIQLFLPDGTFYREVRFGGPLGALASPQWLPFDPKDSTPTPETRQLDALAEKLADKDYLTGFWAMVLKAQAGLSAAPTSYAQFLNSIVGKPLALVNVGVSLELDGPPREIQSTLSNITKPERELLPPSDPDDKTPYYHFQVRLGNESAEYDGLVGYFDTTGPQTDELNLDVVKTFFPPDEQPGDVFQALGTDNYPVFTAYWEPPFPTVAPYDKPELIVEPDVYDDRRNSHMTVFGTIVDVFTPVQAYMSFLPPVSLLLPQWTWQKAFETMTAFFHAGPLTVPLNDVPEFKEDQLLTVANARDLPKRDLPLPGLGPGDWSWFQPYPVAAGASKAEGDPPPVPKFNPFGIQKRGNLLKPGFQDGPYAAIEGFLQLRNPIMMPRPDPPPETAA